MNREFELKVQALVDGELASAEVRDIQAQIEKDPQAQALLGELQATRSALRGNEPEYTLPETPEFFWSKIERAIQTEERNLQPKPWLGFAWLHRYWPQLSGATAAAVLLLLAAMHFEAFSHQGWGDIENPLAETGTFCFRSESDRMTLVWVYDRNEEKSELPDTFN